MHGLELLLMVFASLELDHYKLDSFMLNIIFLAKKLGKINRISLYLIYNKYGLWYKHPATQCIVHCGLVVNFSSIPFVGSLCNLKFISFKSATKPYISRCSHTKKKNTNN